MSKKILLRGDIKLAQQYVGFARKKATKWQLFASDQQRTIVRRYKLEDEGVDIHIKALPHRAYINIEAGKLTFSYFLWGQGHVEQDLAMFGFGIAMPTSIEETTTSIDIAPIFSSVLRGDAYEEVLPDLESHFCYEPGDGFRSVREAALFLPESTQGSLFFSYQEGALYPNYICNEFEKYDSDLAYGLTRGYEYPFSNFLSGAWIHRPTHQPIKDIVYSSYYDSYATDGDNAAFALRTEKDFFSATGTAPPFEVMFLMIAWNLTETTWYIATDAQQRLWFVVQNSSPDFYRAIIRTSLAEYERYLNGEITAPEYDAQVELIDYDDTGVDFLVLSEPSVTGSTNAYIAEDSSTAYFYVEEGGEFVEKFSFSMSPYPFYMTNAGLVCISPTEFYWSFFTTAHYGSPRKAFVVKIFYNTELETPAWEAVTEKEYDYTAAEKYFVVWGNSADRYVFITGDNFSVSNAETRFCEVYDVVTKQTFNLLDNASYNGTSLRTLYPRAAIGPNFHCYST